MEGRIDYQILWVKGLSSVDKRKTISFATSSLTLWASITMGNTFFSFSVFSIYMALQSSHMWVICSFNFCPIATLSNKCPPPPSLKLPSSHECPLFSEISNKEVCYVGLAKVSWVTSIFFSGWVCSIHTPWKKN